MPRSKSFEEEVAYYKQKKARQLREVDEAFGTSAAVRASWSGQFPHEEMWILSRDTHPVDEGQDRPWRISRFGKDGPFGHDVAATREKAYELAESWFGTSTSVTPMAEQEVIEWTSTPQYQEGVKHVAFMQALNTVSWKAAGHPPNEAELRAAYDAGWKLAHAGQIEEATELLERSLGARRNPPPAFVQNPAWVAKVVADNYDKLVRELGPAWLPKFGELRSSRNRISGSIKELGCGAYGCVLPMERHDMVLKITTDPSEMDFVVKILPDLPAEITVKYKAWMWLRSTHAGRRVGLLWREAADWVGNIEGALPKERALDALVAIRAQHDAASDAVHAVLKGQLRALPGLIAVWGGLTQRMMRVPELAFVARGMLEAWNQKGVFFADVHEGNLGRVMRDGQPTWVITDPGNVIVIGGDETAASDPEDQISEGEAADLEKLFAVNPGDMPGIARVPFPFERKPQIPGSWHKRAKVGDIDLSRVIATQRYVTEAGLAKYKRKRKVTTDQDLPLVYRTDDGSYYVADGHHRLTAARLRGETHSAARIVDIGDPDHPIDKAQPRMNPGGAEMFVCMDKDLRELGRSDTIEGAMAKAPPGNTYAIVRGEYTSDGTHWGMGRGRQVAVREFGHAGYRWYRG